MTDNQAIGVIGSEVRGGDKTDQEMMDIIASPQHVLCRNCKRPKREHRFFGTNDMICPTALFDPDLKEYESE